MRRITLFSLWIVLLAAPVVSAATDVADAAMRGDREAVRAAIARKADVNATQVDGTTALHWAAERDDLAMADLLIKAGARPAGVPPPLASRTRSGCRPLVIGESAYRGSADFSSRSIARCRGLSTG